MNSVVDISWAKLAAFSLILLVPLAINARYKIRHRERCINQRCAYDFTARSDRGLS